MPTRYALELEGLKGVVSDSTLKEPSQRTEAKKTVKKIFEERYTGGKNRWFFTPLRVRTVSLLSHCCGSADEVDCSSERWLAGRRWRWKRGSSVGLTPGPRRRLSIFLPRTAALHLCVDFPLVLSRPAAIFEPPSSLREPYQSLPERLRSNLRYVLIFDPPLSGQSRRLPPSSSLCCPPSIACPPHDHFTAPITTIVDPSHP